MEVYLVIVTQEDWKDVYGVYKNKKYAEHISHLLNDDFRNRENNMTSYVKIMEVIENENTN